jgi:hypothetical protein
MFADDTELRPRSVKFVFADEKSAKQRPRLIVSIDRHHPGRRETIMAASRFLPHAGGPSSSHRRGCYLASPPGGEGLRRTGSPSGLCGPHARSVSTVLILNQQHLERVLAIGLTEHCSSIHPTEDARQSRQPRREARLLSIALCLRSVVQEAADPTKLSAFNTHP